MRILLTGTNGQVGWELQRSLAVLGDLHCPNRAQLDLARPASVLAWLDTHRPQLVVNPAAYTAVDKAEQEPAQAMAVNRDSPASMAQWCARHQAALIHFSSDYVYDGLGQRPFVETDRPAPAGVYAASKLAGDEAIAASGASHLIFRTSWVYGARGKNFLNTILRLADSAPQLRVVGDQVGAPTPARLLAETTLAVLARHGASAQDLLAWSGTYHVAPTGWVSWHGFAQAILHQRVLLTGKASPPLHAITTSDYPTPAVRPANSRLSLDKLQAKLGVQMPTWESGLAQVMAERLAYLLP